MASIKSITYRPLNSDQAVPEVGYLRVSLEKATLVEGHGIENDYNASPRRNLNIMDVPTLAELDTEGYPTTPGALGENMILDGIDLRTIAGGTQLRLGTDAVIEIVKPRNGCELLHKIDARMPDQTAGRIGMMCQIIKAGEIKVGDPVEILKESVGESAQQ